MSLEKDRILSNDEIVSLSEKIRETGVENEAEVWRDDNFVYKPLVEILEQTGFAGDINILKLVIESDYEMDLFRGFANKMDMNDALLEYASAAIDSLCERQI